MTCKVTVFTATFNRRHTLHRVYESLCKQTFKDFEWVVVDDGSTDNTQELIDSWKDNASFSIQYIWQPNGHKKAAFNRGVQLASGAFFLILDSDDACEPHALEFLLSYWETIPAKNRDRYAGVGCLNRYNTGDLVGNKYPCETFLDSDGLELRYRHKVYGDKCLLLRTNVLRNYSYPENLPGHVPESCVWILIDLKYKMRYFNDILYICYLDAGNQITKSINPRLNAPGALYWKKMILEYELPWFWYAPVSFVLNASRWTRFRLHTDRKALHEVNFWPKNIIGILLILLTMPIGLLWWSFDLWRAKAK